MRRRLTRRPVATVTDLRRPAGIEVATQRGLIGVVMPLWLGRNQWPGPCTVPRP